MGERTTIFAGQVVTDIMGVPTPTYANLPVEIRALSATPYAPTSGNATFLPTSLRYCSMPATGEAGVVPVRAVSGQTLPVSGTVNVSELIAANSAANKCATYRVVLPSFGAGGYGAYATPTDLITIQGSDTKTVIVTAFNMTIQATSAAIAICRFIRRSTANSGGVYSNPTPVKMSSNNPAPSASINVYTGAPTLGADNGIIAYSVANIVTLTSSPYALNIAQLITPSANQSTNSQQGFVIHGANESLCLNWNGAALPAGFSAGYNIEWIEFGT